jgi:hypothetical protein
MALPKFKKQEDVPEAFRDLYHEVDGEWVPKEDGGEGPTQADVDALKHTLDTVRDELKTMGGKVKDAEDRAKTAEGKLKDAETSAAGKKAGLSDEKLQELKDKITADITAEFQSRLDKLQEEVDRRDKVDTENRQLKLDQKIKAQMLEKGVLGQHVDDLFKLTFEEYDLTDNDTPMLKNHPGKDIGVFIEDTLKPRYKTWFKGTQGDGGGAGDHLHGAPKVGTTAEDVLANPAGAMESARAAAK